MNFLHRQAPVEPVAAYRILVGSLMFLESAGWLSHTTELFSNEGFHVPNFTWLAVPPPWLALLLCLVLVLSSLCVAIGMFTRVSIAITVSIWFYFYGLDSLNEKAAQTIAMVNLTILLFSNCGHRLSMDRVLRLRRGKPDYPGQSSVFPQRMLQFEFAQIYFFSGVSKLMNPDWVNGNVFYYVLNGRWATPLGIFVSSMKPDIIARASGLGTILFELFMGMLLFIPPVRPYAIAAGVLFHSGIQATLWVGTLGFHFISGLVTLFPEPETVAARVRSLRKEL
jgi:hypothetical protein